MSLERTLRRKSRDWVSRVGVPSASKRWIFSSPYTAPKPATWRLRRSHAGASSSRVASRPRFCLRSKTANFLPPSAKKRSSRNCCRTPPFMWCSTRKLLFLEPLRKRQRASCSPPMSGPIRNGRAGNSFEEPNFRALLILFSLLDYGSTHRCGALLRGRYYVPLKCAADACPEASVASLDEREVCRTHFLTGAYRHLEVISGQIQAPAFHTQQGEAASHFLEECMREATNIACAPELLNNLERAQLLDILLWASELYVRLRRGPRVRASIPILVRSEDAQKPWEEKTETLQLSVHGFCFLCRHELHTGDVLTCVRLDNGRRLGGRVVWTRSKDSGETEAGVEFVTDEDFWEMAASVATPLLLSKRR